MLILFNHIAIYNIYFFRLSEFRHLEHKQGIIIIIIGISNSSSIKR